MSKSENNKESNKFDLKVRTKSRKNTTLVLASLIAVNNNISFDFLSLQFDLALYGREAHFRFERVCFMRSNAPKNTPSKMEVHIAALYGDDEAKKKYPNARLTDSEKLKIKNHAIGEATLTPYNLAKTVYPNCRLYYDTIPAILGNIRIYIYNAKLYLQFSGKLMADKNFLGYITRENINEALNRIKATGLIGFDNEVFITNARVLRCDIVEDINTDNPNALIKAFSSYLPLRTNKYAVIGYTNGYEIIQRGKKGEYELAIYHKGKEINTQGTDKYKRTIELEGIEQAQNIVRLELRIFKFIAQRLFLMDDEVIPDKDNEEIIGDETDEENEPTDKKPKNLTLQELLNVDKKPIIHMLNLLAINQKALKKARGKYLVTSTPTKSLKIADFQRMIGCLALLENNDYDFDKVRSHIEVELGKPMPTNYLDDMRGRLQDYIACYKPRTVMMLQKLLENLNY